MNFFCIFSKFQANKGSVPPPEKLFYISVWYIRLSVILRAMTFHLKTQHYYGGSTHGSSDGDWQRCVDGSFFRKLGKRAESEATLRVSCMIGLTLTIYRRNESKNGKGRDRNEEENILITESSFPTFFRHYFSITASNYEQCSGSSESSIREY